MVTDIEQSSTCRHIFLKQNFANIFDMTTTVAMKYLIVIALLIAASSPTMAFSSQPPKNCRPREPNTGNRILPRWQTTSRHYAQAEEYYDTKQPRHYKIRARQGPTYSRRRIRLARPVRVLVNGIMCTSSRQDTELNVSSGFTFDDGDQLLVSAQKPLGLILEERGREEADLDFTTGTDARHRRQNCPNGCIVAEVLDGSAAKRAGVKPGDFLVAVQNADVTIAHFDEVMQRIGDAPQVVNLRFWRKDWDDSAK